VKGRGFTRGLVGRDWATSVSKRDNAKDGGLPKHLLDFFFGVGVSIVFLLRVLLFFCFSL
jgi:hypothetical protein